MTINNLLPGVFDTDRIRTTKAGAAAKVETKTEDEIVAARLASVPARRLGVPTSWRQRAPSCAVPAHGAYVTGQNI